MKRFLAQPSLDTTGFWASAICAVHCVAVPVLLSFTAFSSLAFLEDASVEYTILSLSIIIGVASLLPSYFRHHRKLNALLILFIGFMLIGLSRFTEVDLFESMLTSGGAATVASAHVVNFKLCKKYEKGS
jgi:hypothetical protein